MQEENHAYMSGHGSNALICQSVCNFTFSSFFESFQDFSSAVISIKVELVEIFPIASGNGGVGGGESSS